MTNNLTYGLCDQLFQGAVVPFIKAGAEAGILNRFDGSLVVLKPAGLEPVDNSQALEALAAFGPDWAAQIPNLDDVLYAGVVVPGSPDSATYMKNAFAKAAMCQRTGLKSSVARYEASYYYHSNDCVWGGAVIENGFIVGFSGVQEQFDEVISATMLGLIRGACQAPMRQTLPIHDFNGWLA